MPIVILRVHVENGIGLGRPTECPQCGGEILHGWGTGEKIVKDIDQSVAQIHRYRCNNCGHTFRYYPSGLDRSHISPRVRRLAAIAWALGMSSRDVSIFFSRFGIQLSHTTIWRDGHNLIATQGKYEESGSVRRFNLDSRFLPGISNRLGVVIAIDLGAGKLSVLGTVDEYNPRNVISQLKILVGDLVEVVTTETKGFYRALDQARVS